MANDQGDFIVKINNIEEAKAFEELLGTYELKPLLGESGIYALKFKEHLNFDQIDEVHQILDIEFIVENAPLPKREGWVDGDKFNVTQWNVKSGTSSSKYSSDAEAAWEEFGLSHEDSLGNKVVVAVVDGGFDLEHIAITYWKNEGEIAGNGIDDDNNGYIDDYDGWNPESENGNLPVESHGTHVSGIVGGLGEYAGDPIYGIFPGVEVMPITYGDTIQDTIEAYTYILDQKKRYYLSNGVMGANVVSTNSSFGYDEADCTSDTYEMWNAIYNELGKWGILSAVATTNGHADVDVVGDVPSACQSPYTISVGNIGEDGETMGGYGAKSVDIHAQGTQVFSSTPGNTYRFMTGTSMATPHVAGAIAYLHTIAPVDFSTMYHSNLATGAYMLKQTILSSAIKKADLLDLNYSGGFLNLERAARLINGDQSVEFELEF